MSNNLTQSELREIALEVVKTVQDVILGKNQPYSQDIQSWAASLMKQLDTTDNALAEAVERCLIDILSCDNASWDTPISGFQENLDILIEVLKVETLENEI